MYRTERGLDRKGRGNFLFSDPLSSATYTSFLHRSLIQRGQQRVRGVALSLTAAWATWQFPETAFCLVLFLLSLSSIFLFQLPYCFDWCWSLSGDEFAYPPSSSWGGAGGVLKFSSNSSSRSLNHNLPQAAHFWWEKLGAGVPTSLKCWYHSTAGTLLQVEDAAKRLPKKLFT